ncbi:hypothetical protein [Lyngbya aestuarii]|uniref:hypothetical protein n=1 Tax=Lyngbya aestuarii TaxID=118322 RepID=UPI00403DFA7F
MRHISLIALVSLVGLLIGSCQIGGDTEEAAVDTVESSPAVSPATPEASPAEPKFAKPLEPQKNADPVAVAGLIQTLPPEAVVKQLESGRSDPFAVFPVQPEVTVSANPGAATRPVQRLPNIPPSGQSGSRTNRNQPVARSNVLPQPKPPAAQGRGASASKPGTPARGNAGSASASKPGTPARASGSTSTPQPGGSSIAAIPELTPVIPELPDPEQAKGVKVTGVIQVGGIPSAIVEVPNEPARYVRVGQRLSNGQVLVKRIEINAGPEPIVVLEQYGVEVARRVGEQPAEAQKPGSPTASLPAPSLVGTKIFPQV